VEAPGPISWEDFLAVEIRVGTVRRAELNPKARKPAYVMEIDFGPEGTRTTSSQLTGNYRPGDLVGRQVLAVMNFPPKRIAGVKSQVLVLGAVGDACGVVLVEPREPVPDGTRIL